MEDILRPIYQERASLKSTLGILLIKKWKMIGLIQTRLITCFLL